MIKRPAAAEVVYRCPHVSMVHRSTPTYREAWGVWLCSRHRGETWIDMLRSMLNNSEAGCWLGCVALQPSQRRNRFRHVTQQRRRGVG